MHDETDHWKVEKLHQFRTQVMVVVVQHFLLLFKIPWKQRLWTFPLQYRDSRIRKLHLLSVRKIILLSPPTMLPPIVILFHEIHIFSPKEKRILVNGVWCLFVVIYDKRWPTADDGCPLFPTLQVIPKEKHKEREQNFFSTCSGIVGNKRECQMTERCLTENKSTSSILHKVLDKFYRHSWASSCRNECRKN